MTKTFSAKAVTVKAGDTFRVPVLVICPSVLDVQFEVQGGGEIEFSITFVEEGSRESRTLCDAVSCADREGNIDIDMSGTCECTWSNASAWLSSKTLSYTLQLTPLVDTRCKRRLEAAMTAATDFRMLSAVEVAEQVDADMKGMKERTLQLQQTSIAAKEKSAHAQVRYERYMQHVRRLEVEVAAARALADAEASELATHHRAAATAERSMAALEQAQHRTASSHRIASHAQHRIASHRIASHRIASHRIA